MHIVDRHFAAENAHDVEGTMATYTDDRAGEQARAAPVHLRERHGVVDVPPVACDQAER